MSNRTIWKQVLTGSREMVELPFNAEIICVKQQHGNVCFWFECDPNAPKVERIFHVIGTGQPIPENCKYRGTCFLAGSSLVLHVYEVIHEQA